MQADGNQVLYRAGSTKAVWATGTASPGAFAQMQTDENFVVYSTAGKALWSSGTASPGAFLEVQADGNAVVYSSANKALWSRTGGLVR
jgi:phosphoribosyl-AMP cyclohydrolase